MLLSVVLVINSTMQESRQFIDLLYKTQEEFADKSEEMEVLKRLVSYSKNFMREFSAAGYFSLDRGIIFSVLGNVATYLVIVIQVNENRN